MITRFAPSPTGYLHLGHVVNALYVWGYAGAHGGRVLTRIEDHDRIRSRPEYERALLEDLAWLGFDPHDATRQSDEAGAYEEALARLRRTAHVYACDCSRKDIRLQQSGGDAGDADGVAGGSAERYGGRCRARGLEEKLGYGLRVVLAPGVECFDDLRLGPQEQSPSLQCGDLLLRDRDGHWTYQFAVTVDDVRQRITRVIRGADLLSSTGRQIQMARMLGRAELPRFLHHPLVTTPSGEKLSKAAGDTGIRELRAAGVSAEDVIGLAAAAVGLIPRPRPMAATNVADLFR